MGFPVSIGFTNEQIAESIKDSFDVLIQNNEDKLPEQSPFILKNIPAGEVFTSLFASEISAYVFPMSIAPFELPDELIYFAITRQPSKNRIIICGSEHYNAQNDLRLESGTIIGVLEKSDGYVLKHLNPHIVFKVISNDLVLLPEQWKINGIQAVLTYEFDEFNSKFSKDEYYKIALHPDEFPEPAGSERLLWLGHRESVSDFIKLRKVFHQPDEVNTSNIERLIQQKLQKYPDFGLRVRCFRDTRQNYHVKAMLIHLESGMIFQHSISQSTHYSLAEKVISVVTQYIQKERSRLCI